MTIQIHSETTGARPAIVSKSSLRDTDAMEYLRLGTEGAASWVTDPHVATAFPSMRDATRMAMRLPASVRAFGLPLETELQTFSCH